MKTLFILAINLLALAGTCDAQVSGGGGFILEQSVFGAGGGTGSGGQFHVTGTGGQAIAGTRPAASIYNGHTGFWNGAPLAPSASTVSISGRVTTAGGQGITNVRITLAEPNGNSQTALTGPLGYYSFPEIAAGQTVVINVAAKRYTFSQPTLILTVTDSLGEVSFVSIE